MSAHLRGEERARLAAELAARYTAGATMQQLAIETGRSYTLVRHLLHEAKTPIRPPGLPKGTMPRRSR
ncbi:helix-turn-helix domain-containing protein [Streptomyces sp. NPDC049577]|uniref:helix-turn-helix domain-containing protein n=1 Tax=Streptomyces sp. NPDC049577 TaxID=3155153 RepID=UPI003417BC00